MNTFTSTRNRILEPLAATKRHKATDHLCYIPSPRPTNSLASRSARTCLWRNRTDSHLRDLGSPPLQVQDTSSFPPASVLEVPRRVNDDPPDSTTTTLFPPESPAPCCGLGSNDPPRNQRGSLSREGRNPWHRRPAANVLQNHGYARAHLHRNHPPMARCRGHAGLDLWRVLLERLCLGGYHPVSSGHLSCFDPEELRLLICMSLEQGRASQWHSPHLRSVPLCRRYGLPHPI